MSIQTHLESFVGTNSFIDMSDGWFEGGLIEQGVTITSKRETTVSGSLFGCFITELIYQRADGVICYAYINNGLSSRKSFWEETHIFTAPVPDEVLLEVLGACKSKGLS